MFFVRNIQKVKIYMISEPLFSFIADSVSCIVRPQYRDANMVGLGESVSQYVTNNAGWRSLQSFCASATETTPLHYRFGTLANR